MSEDDNMRGETEYKLPDFPELNFITRSIVTQVGTRAHTLAHEPELKKKKAEREVGGKLCVINPKSVLSTSKPVFLYCSIFPCSPYLSIFLSCCLSEVQLPYQKG